MAGQEGSDSWFGRRAKDAQDASNTVDSFIGSSNKALDLRDRLKGKDRSEQERIDKYCDKLGEWADEAVDEKGRWLQPVLHTKPLEGHLDSEQGRPKPQGPHGCSLAWGQLLYALNIRPGAGVLEWKLPPGGIDPNLEAATLLVDGPAMCHIINLYRLYREPAPANFSPARRTSQRGSNRDDSRCEFPFGTLRVNDEPMGRPRDIDFVATFQPGSGVDLEQERRPFSHPQPGVPGALESFLRFEKSCLMAKYIYGVYEQFPVVDSAGFGPMPSQDEPLKQRAEYYVLSTRLLSSVHACHAECERVCLKTYDEGHLCTEKCERRCLNEGMLDWSKSRVVTHEWLDEIERFKRQATTNSGLDEGLLEFIMSSLERQPEFVEHVKAILVKFGHDLTDRWDGWV